jgi:hypothetical protein
MATNNLPVHSEVLCYLQNNFSCTAKSILMSSLSGFYSTDEISNAKTLMFLEAEKIKSSGTIVDIPRMVNRRSGDSKKKADLDDLFDLWERLDTSKIVLPSFHAINLSRIPPLSFSSADVCSLSAMVHEMKQQLDDMQSKFTELSCHIKHVQSSHNTPQASLPGGIVHDQSSQAAHSSLSVEDKTTTSRPAALPANTGSWAVHASAGSSNQSPGEGDGFTLVSYKKVKSPVKNHTLCGTRALGSNDKVKALPRRLSLYVGRLQKDTTCEDLSEFLKDNGISDPICRKLAAKDGRTFNSAAFMVSCDIKDKDLVYDEATWPSGCELRDWVFYERKSMPANVTSN